MHFGPTDAQERLRARVRAVLADVSPPAEVRRLMGTDLGFDPGAWMHLATEHDLVGLHLPEEVGGSGLGWVEQSVVLEETGRVLLCAPYLSTVTAAAAILAAGGEDEVLAAVAGGLCTATLAVAEATGRWDGAGVQTRAVPTPGGGGWRLEGEKSYVVDGCAADVLVVAARADGDDGEAGLFVVESGAPGLHRAPLSTVDQTRKQARITLAATPARPLPGVSVDTAMDRCAVALAAEQVGGAQRCLEAAVEHAGRRVQFGRPVGSFQAVKHLCAGMLLEVESARGAAFYAARAAARGDAELPAAAAVAQSCCSEAYVRVATDSLHVHGGLGFTWDHDAHLYFKRARSSQLLFGHPRHHRERLARLLGL
ncbi:MAG: acyl-CoA dehydrogenase family protein [Acidimicrobiales bacterium]